MPSRKTPKEKIFYTTWIKFNTKAKLLKAVHQPTKLGENELLRSHEDKNDDDEKKKFNI